MRICLAQYGISNHTEHYINFLFCHEYWTLFCQESQVPHNWLSCDTVDSLFGQKCLLISRSVRPATGLSSSSLLSSSSTIFCYFDSLPSLLCLPVFISHHFINNAWCLHIGNHYCYGLGDIENMIMILSISRSSRRHSRSRSSLGQSSGSRLNRSGTQWTRGMWAWRRLQCCW